MGLWVLAGNVVIVLCVATSVHLFKVAQMAAKLAGSLTCQAQASRRRLSIVSPQPDRRKMLAAHVLRDSEPVFHRMTLGTACDAGRAGYEPAGPVVLRPAIQLSKSRKPIKTATQRIQKWTPGGCERLRYNRSRPILVTPGLR